MNRRTQRKSLVDQIVLAINGCRIGRLQGVIGSFAQIAQLVIDDCQFQQADWCERMIHAAVKLQRANKDLLGLVEVLQSSERNPQGNAVPGAEQTSVAISQGLENLNAASAERVKPRGDSFEHASPVQGQGRTTHDLCDVDLPEFRILDHATLLGYAFIIKSAKENLKRLR